MLNASNKPKIPIKAVAKINLQFYLCIFFKQSCPLQQLRIWWYLFSSKETSEVTICITFLYLVHELVIKRENIKDAVFTFRQTVLA